MLIEFSIFIICKKTQKMKIILAILIFLFFNVSSFSQTSRERLKESTFNPSSFEAFKVEIKKGKKDEPAWVQYRTATFIDCRPDTSKIGFVLAGANSDEYHRILFPKPVAAYMNEKVAPFLVYDDSAKANITFFIKQLWVSEALVKPNTYARSMLVGPIDYLSFCYINADCYTSKNGFHSFIGNIDTVISLRKWIVNAADDLLKKALMETLKKADSLYISGNITGQSVNEESLLKKYQADFDLPILKNEWPQKGVFSTYMDFINNKPSVRNFEVVKDKKIEYLKSPETTDSSLNKSWGYYDGTDLNIHINNNYYRLLRNQNTFDLAGPRSITKLFGTGAKIINTTIATFFKGFLLSGGFTLMTMGSTNKIMKELVPYQLNIRDGLIY